jgi:hypothetical protein
MQYSPKLKTAMNEIAEIMKKYDIAGFVTLHTTSFDKKSETSVGFSEHRSFLTPSYSCVKIEPNDSIRFYLKKDEVGVEKSKEIASNTLNMIQHLAEVVGRSAVSFMDMEELLAKNWHDQLKDTGRHSSDQQQNN